MAFPRRTNAPATDNRGARIAQIGEVDTTSEVIDIDAMTQAAVVAQPSHEIMGSTPAPSAPQGQPEAAKEPVETPQPVVPVEPTAPVEPPDPLRAKWEAMTPEQQTDSWINAQRLQGRQGEELGLLRKLAEKVLIQPPVNQDNPAKVAPVTAPANREELVTRLLTEPDVVINEIIGQSLSAHKQQGEQARFTTKMQEVEQRYKSDPAFANFLDTMPKWIKEAANTPEAIDDVINQFTPKQQPARQSAPKLGVSSVPSAAAAPQTPGVTFTHAQLADMMLRRPQEYASRQAEIWKAYEEGRVK